MAEVAMGFVLASPLQVGEVPKHFQILEFPVKTFCPATLHVMNCAMNDILCVLSPLIQRWRSGVLQLKLE